MGQSATQALRGVWATINARRRSRARTAGGVDLADRARQASDWGAAVQGYVAYLQRAPRDFGVRMRLIKTLYAAGRLEEADAEARKAVLDRPDKAELISVLSDIEAARQASVPVTDYHRFRSQLVLPSAPHATTEIRSLKAVVDGRDKTPLAIEATVDSLRGSITPVESICVWSSNDGAEDQGVLADAVLVLEAGVVMDPQAIGWLVHALQQTDAAAVYGDDDRAIALEGAGRRWSDPAFHAAPHPLDIETTPRLPAAVLFRGAEAASDRSQPPRERLLTAFERGPVAHVPLLLATSLGDEDVEALPHTPAAPEIADRARILAIIPTRDEGAVLERMVESLISNAADAAALDIIIVDNGSLDPQTLSLLETLSRNGVARVIRIDEAFNWSRLNNIAAAGADADILLFANNDMNMLTPGWDDRLRDSLLRPGVGVVGARLTYPNGRVQHAGMALGALKGRPVHEGLGVEPSDAGPLSRWHRRRPAAAVTGAFMGVRRDSFEAAGGFNALEFAIGCNDIDFCLRVRALGWTVVYDGALELVHWESHSRGHDDTEPKMRRAEAEHAALDRIWGDQARKDPSRNPHWVNHETLVFYGLRQPDTAVVRAWIRDSARPFGASRQA